MFLDLTGIFLGYNRDCLDLSGVVWIYPGVFLDMNIRNCFSYPGCFLGLAGSCLDIYRGFIWI